MLTRDDILTSDDLKREVVNVPEWGGEVLVQEMSGAMRDAYENDIRETGDDMRPQRIRARMAAFTIVDEEGERVFTVDDIDALAQKSGKALDRVFTAAAMLNVITEEAVEAAEGN